VIGIESVEFQTAGFQLLVVAGDAVLVEQLLRTIGLRRQRERTGTQ
jgi:phosphotransferase system IIA component